jgi:GH35 family endo-1,4-beta-xylanase
LPDRYVSFGEKNHMFIVGHTLVWHNQVPAWVFQDENGNPTDREALLKRLGDHIHTVVGRYHGRINGWDVVNEALEEDGTLRQTPCKVSPSRESGFKAITTWTRRPPSRWMPPSAHSLRSA